MKATWLVSFDDLDSPLICRAPSVELRDGGSFEDALRVTWIAENLRRRTSPRQTRALASLTLSGWRRLGGCMRKVEVDWNRWWESFYPHTPPSWARGAWPVHAAMLLTIWTEERGAASH